MKVLDLYNTKEGEKGERIYHTEEIENGEDFDGCVAKAEVQQVEIRLPKWKCIEDFEEKSKPSKSKLRGSRIRRFKKTSKKSKKNEEKSKTPQKVKRFSRTKAEAFRRSRDRSSHNI